MEAWGPFWMSVHRAKMTQDKLKITPPGTKSTPQSAAAEIRAQLADLGILTEAQAADLTDPHRRDPSAPRLDPHRAATWTAARLERCGSFERGRLVLEWPTGESLNLGAHQCNNRLCPRCGRRRGHKLTEEMEGALNYLEAWGFKGDRIRLATLTVPNTRSVAEGITHLAEAWHRTLAAKSWGSLVAGAFRCFEVKPGKDGRWNVHLHALLFLWRTGAPYAVLRRAWDQAAGGRFNQRFDLIREKAKAKQGQSKANAAARYLVKYLTKVEDSTEARKAPGGLPHLLAALEGRRMFGATGCAAEARRIFQRERPAWTAQLGRSARGFRHAGLAPDRAYLVSRWGEAWEVPIPKPAAPAALRDASPAEPSEDADPTPARERVTRYDLTNPLDSYDWRKLPTHRWNPETWEAWAEGRRYSMLRTKTEHTNPKPFRWRRWRKAAPVEWTQYAHNTLGERHRGSLGALLWQKVAPPDEGPATDPRSPNHLHQVILSAFQDAKRTLARQVHTAHTWPERHQVIFGREFPLPHHLTRIFVEDDL